MTNGHAVRSGKTVSCPMRINKYNWSVDRALTEGAKQCA